MHSARNSILASVLFAAVIALPAAADDNAEANRLFVAAVTGWNAAAAIESDELAALEERAMLLQEVRSTLARIIADHSGSDLAVRLVIGETIGPLSLPAAETAEVEARDRLDEAICTNAPTRDCVLALAMDAAAGIEDADSRSRTLRAIAAALAEAELFAQALEVARGIQDATDRSQALREIAAALADPDLFAEALEVARGIEEPRFRAPAFARIAAQMPDLP